jgi:hypothetical protein
VRANTLIPTIEPASYLTDEPFDEVTFDSYVLETGEFALKDLDGTSRVAVALKGTRADVEFQSPKSRLNVHLFPLAGLPPIETVHVNGKRCQQVHHEREWTDNANVWLRAADGSIKIRL